MRNCTQKISEDFISSISSYIDEEGNEKCKFCFRDENSTYKIGENPRRVLLERILSGELFQHKEDVATQCEQYFLLLIEGIYDCYDKFGNTIDPEKYYTLENLKCVNKSIEDIEEQLGFPRGYTKVEGFTDEMRIELLRESEPWSEIDYIFEKYLNKVRYKK